MNVIYFIHDNSSLYHSLLRILHPSSPLLPIRLVRLLLLFNSQGSDCNFEKLKASLARYQMAEASDDVRGGGGGAHGSFIGGDNDAKATGFRSADGVVPDSDRFDSEGGSVVWINYLSLPENLQADISSFLASAPVLSIPPTEYPALPECQLSLPEDLTSEDQDMIDALLALRQSRKVRKPQPQKVKTEQYSRHVELRQAVTGVDKDRSNASRAANAPTIAPVLGVAIPKRRRSTRH